MSTKSVPKVNIKAKYGTESDEMIPYKLGIFIPVSATSPFRGGNLKRLDQLYILRMQTSQT